jgi:hypothetical protein
MLKIIFFKKNNDFHEQLKNLIIKFLISILLIALNTSTIAKDFKIITKDYRFMWDTATRINKQESSDKSTQLFFGFDYQHNIKLNRRNFATILMQPTIIKLNNVAQPFNYFSGGDDIDLQWRAAYIDFTGISDERFNVRTGHIEIPYGAEYKATITGGTLRQLTTNLGLKMDWGISTHGKIYEANYEFAYTRGSGNEWDRAEGASISSGRVGWDFKKNHHVALSYVDGALIPGKSTQLINKKRTALDYHYQKSDIHVRGEISKGQDNNSDRHYGLIEISKFNSNRDKFYYFQYRYKRDQDGNINRTDESLISGLEWRPHNNIELNLQYHNKIAQKNPINDLISDKDLMQLQLRYRFNE